MLTVLAVLALSTPAPGPVAVEIPALAMPEPSIPLALPSPVFSDDPQMEYTYVELNYLWTDSDAADKSVDGVELIGSLELPLNFFAQGGVTHQSSGVDVDTYRLGAGYHLPLGSRIDAYGLLSYLHSEIDGSGSDFKDDGAAAELGLRFLLTEKIELNGAAKWVDSHDSDAGVALGARFYLMNRLSLGGRVESIGQDVSVAAGARLEL